jgi:hypothetical protein
VDECIRQYIYDAISEYRVSQLRAPLTPDAVRRLKETLLRIKAVGQDMMPQADAQADCGDSAAAT